MIQINWDNFPDYASSRMFLNLSLPINSSSKSSRRNGETGPPPVPYQFTLAVMFALYCHLQGAVKFDKKNRAANFVECDSSDPREKYRLFKNVISSGHAPKPLDYDQTLKRVPLRAIAYFSWEKERRCFITRRVYPTYFDFLSYSHVPEGWGALGVMLAEILAGKYQHQTHTYTKILDAKGAKTFIPYFSEVVRLKYNSILVIPIFRPDKPQKHDIAHLLGAFVFYVKGPEDLPSGSHSVKHRIKMFANEMGRKLLKHDELITKGILPLVKVLENTYPEKTKEGSDTSICELTIQLESKGDIEDLNEVTSSVMRSLSGTKYFSVIGTTDAASRSRTVFVVSLDKDANTLEDKVCEVMGRAFKGKKQISYDLCFRQRR